MLRVIIFALTLVVGPSLAHAEEATATIDYYSNEWRSLAGSSDLQAVFFADLYHGWAAGKNGVILATTDGGRHWERQPSHVVTTLRSLHFLNASAGFAAGDGGTVLRTLDGGKSWQVLGNPWPPVTSSFPVVYDIYFVDTNIGWISGEGILFKTSDGGRSWERQDPGTPHSIYSLYFSDANNGYAVSYEATISRTTDGGATWTIEKRDESAIYREVKALPDTVVVLGDEEQYNSTTDGWSAQPFPSIAGVNGGYILDDEHVWVIGDEQIARTVDGGANWTTVFFQPPVAANPTAAPVAQRPDVPTLPEQPDEQNSAPDTATATPELPSAVLTAPTEGTDDGALANRTVRTVVVRPDGTIVSSDYIGPLPDESPVEVEPIDRSMKSVYFVDPSHGWAVGANETIRYTEDGGLTWAEANSGQDDAAIEQSKLLLEADRWGVVLLATERDGWLLQSYVGDSGALEGLRTSDGGATWSKVSLPGLPPRGSIYDFEAGADGRLWLMGDSGLHIGAIGSEWETPPELQPTELDANFGPYPDLQLVDFSTAVIVGNGKIQRSEDGGKTWQLVDGPASVDPLRAWFIDRNVGWLVDRNGAVHRTTDGGETWETVAPLNQSVIDLYFVDSLHGWAVSGSGAAWTTVDGGEKWTPLTVPNGEPVQRIYFTTPNEGWMFSSSSIFASRDGGKNWRVVVSYEDYYVLGGASAGQDTWIATDRNGVIATSYTPGRPLTLRATHEDVGDRIVLTVTPDSTDIGPTTSLRVEARAGQIGLDQGYATWVDAKHAWELSWDPMSINARADDRITYRVSIDDGGPPLAPVEFALTYEPWLELWWKENKGEFSTLGIALGALLLWFAIFFGFYLFRPAALAGLSAPQGLAAMAQGGGRYAIVAQAAQWLIEIVLFPILCRSGRVRREWAKGYLAGKRKLDDLGTVARPVFAEDPTILDAWVAKMSERGAEALNKLTLFSRRELYLQFPVEREGHPTIDKPSETTLRPLFKNKRSVVSIIGIGGSGKSTLACAIARWSMREQPAERLFEHRAIPVFIVEETTDLMKSIKENLAEMLDNEPLPDDLLKGLLLNKRILVIVDALSERDEETQRHVETCYKTDMPVNALIVTSRKPVGFGALNHEVLRPTRLVPGNVVTFIIGYVAKEKDEQKHFNDGGVQIKLGEMIFYLARAAGDEAPMTPLLVTLFVDSAAERLATGKTLDDLPSAIPDIFTDYLERLAATEDRAAIEKFVRGAQLLAELSLSNNRVPQDFPEESAGPALAEFGDDSAWIFSRLKDSAVIEQRSSGGRGSLRFSLDPVAEYMAAIHWLATKRTPEEWTDEVEKLRVLGDRKGPASGYITALGVSYRRFKDAYRIPDITFPWDEPATTPTNAEGAPPAKEPVTVN